ncbi:serine/threonine-protein kinase [Frankia gtarii]|uniref:serine/threonine-protein kinase n=1 Tax=Frankia gtarii TaxID=2950102 RepID=UPI0021C12526|nr:serine/threonine-protein kinase [Frankia gtarii]
MTGKDEAVGRIVGSRYRILDRLGAGGMGTVWRARDETLKVDVALKEVRLPADVSARERAERVARARREAEHAARLRSHPGIVTVHDVLDDAGLPWIVMELITQSDSLLDRLRARRLSVDEVARIGADAADALAFAHDRGVAHRDIKPSNILLTQDGRVLLTDFGIASHHDDSTLTATGVVGTLAYIAPERFGGGPPDLRSDVFSLGVTLYQAVEGALPFGGENTAAMLAAILFEPPRPGLRIGPLGGVLWAMLAKAPAERPDARTAATLLRQAGRPMTITASTQRPAPHPPVSPRLPPAAPPGGIAHPPGGIAHPPAQREPGPAVGRRVVPWLAVPVGVAILLALLLPRLHLTGKDDPDTDAGSASRPAGSPSQGTAPANTPTPTTDSGPEPPVPGTYAINRDFVGDGSWRVTLTSISVGNDGTMRALIRYQKLANQSSLVCPSVSSSNAASLVLADGTRVPLIADYCSQHLGETQCTSFPCTHVSWGDFPVPPDRRASFSLAWYSWGSVTGIRLGSPR